MMLGRGAVVALSIATALLAAAGIVSQLPDEVSVVIRVANGFIIVTLLIWFMVRVEQRARQYEADTRDLYQQIVAVMVRGEENRSVTVARILNQAEHLAAEVAEKAKRESEERHKAMGKKLDAILEAKAHDTDHRL